MQSTCSPASASSHSVPTSSHKRKRGQTQEFGLTILHSAPADAIIADLIFVHGLQGHPQKTWQMKLEAPARKWSIFGLPRRQPDAEEEQELSGGTYWPADILPKDCNNIRILTYGYDSHISHFFKGPTNKLNLSQLGEGLLNRVISERRRSNATGRPIVFVAHSLGGLLVKEALIESKKQGRDVDKTDLYRSTHGIVFFGTPHKGSNDAQWGLILKGIAGAIFDTNDKLLRTLQPDNELLAKMAKDFQDILDEGQLRICSLLESSGKIGLPIFNGKVVPDFSASFGSRKFEHQDYIQQNHMNMCRFSGIDDDGYKCFRDGLDFCMKDIPSVEETREGLLQSLVFDNMSSREAQLIDVNATTLDWIWGLSSGPTSFSQWLSSKTGVFWIQGKPGSGRSTLMKYLKGHDRTKLYLSQVSPRDWTIVHFFFDFRARNGISNNFEGLIRAILYQLACELPELSKSIAEFGIVDSLQPQSQREICWTSTKLHNALLDALQTCTTNILLLIDGVDELEGLGRDMIDMVELFQELDSLDNRDHRVKICIASRPDPLMVTAFSWSSGFKLQDHNYNGIKNYIDRRMKIAVHGPTVPERLGLSLLQFIEPVAKRSQGVFLWARFATDELLEGHANGDDSNDLWARLEALPGELEAIYQRIMTRTIHKHGTSDETSVMIQIAYFTLLSLSIQEFYIVFHHCMRRQVSYKSCSLEAFEKKLRAKTGGLVEVVGGGLGKVKLIHETVRTYCDRLCSGLGRFSVESEDEVVSQELPTRVNNLLAREDNFSSWDSLSCPPPISQAWFPEMFNTVEKRLELDSRGGSGVQAQNFTDIESDVLSSDTSSLLDRYKRTSPVHSNPHTKRKIPLKKLNREQQVISLARKMKACVRCRMQRIRCSKNGLPLNGRRQCKGNKTIMIELHRDHGLPLKLSVRGFTFADAPGGLSLVDTNALGIENLTEATARIIFYIEESISGYIYRELERGDQVTNVCFRAAMEMNRQSETCELIRHVLLIWAAQRVLYENWKVIMPPNSHLEFDTTYQIPIPPILRYQVETILHLQIVKPLQTKVLGKLKETYASREKDDWFSTFLATFILLHQSDSQFIWDNYASQVDLNAFRRADRGFTVNIEHTARALLAHFHYSCKGFHVFSQKPQRPDEEEFFSRLGSTAQNLIRTLRDIIPEEDKNISRYSSPREYDGTSWYRGQMFVSNWFPRPSPFDPPESIDCFST